MSLTEFTQGTQLCSKGEPLLNIMVIAKGSVEVLLNGHPLRFGQGYVIDLYAISSGIHNYTYTATTDVSAYLYPYDDFESLEALMRENTDFAHLMANSMLRQAAESLRYRNAFKKEADNTHELLRALYQQYERLCIRYVFTPKKFDALTNLMPASQSDPLESWIHDYYTEMKDLDPAVQKAFFSKPAIAAGFLYRGSEDVTNILEVCKLYQESTKELSELFLSADGHDIFSLISELHLGLINTRGADAVLDALMTHLVGQMSKMTSIDQTEFSQRLTHYKEELAAKRATQEIKSDAESVTLKKNLEDSLGVILEYSGCDEELRIRFTQNVREFTSVSDRGSADDAVYALRRELTGDFYTLYQSIFIKSLTDNAVPTVVKMFLNFGYVDADLAGHEYADYLYSIVDSVKGDPSIGVYTICEWLTAIHTGKKEPSRNEFDTDYAGHLHELKVQRKIDAAEEARMWTDLDKRLRYEIESVFPTINKITFGRMTTYCPVFSDHNVQRGLEASRVTPASVKEAIEDIRKIDFSAFYRETLFSNHELGVPKETVSVEVLPDIIIMPNVGMRGIMWQEIEGKKRTTPGRMFLPVFYLNDLKQLLIRLTAEFRWEMCKRIQGVHWSDLTDPSLTSEYFHYLQFYRSNRELSTEVKTVVKSELVRAKNVYKTVFVSNYLEWMQYESKGSPRLNKIVRKILFMYCPFASDIREGLGQNPQYAEPLRRYVFKQQQREQHLTRSIEKISKANHVVPRELINELEYIKL